MGTAHTGKIDVARLRVKALCKVVLKDGQQLTGKLNCGRGFLSRGKWSIFGVKDGVFLSWVCHETGELAPSVESVELLEQDPIEKMQEASVELLAALKQCVAIMSHTGGMQDTVDRAQKAIAKATK